MKAKLTIALDLGISLTKGFFSYATDRGIYREGFRSFCSVVRHLTQAKYKSLSNHADDNTALVAFAGSYWLVGEAARGETLSFSCRRMARRYSTA